MPSGMAMDFTCLKLWTVQVWNRLQSYTQAGFKFKSQYRLKQYSQSSKSRCLYRSLSTILSMFWDKKPYQQHPPLASTCIIHDSTQTSSNQVKFPKDDIFDKHFDNNLLKERKKKKPRSLLRSFIYPIMVILTEDLSWSSERRTESSLSLDPTLG